MTENSPQSTMHEVTFPLVWLAAMRLLAAKNDVRFYLNGVAIQDGCLAATTGGYAGVLRHKVFAGLPAVVIPDTAIDAVVRASKGLIEPDVTVRWEGSAGTGADMHGTLAVAGVSVPFAMTACKYPDCLRVLKTSHTKANSEGNPQYPWRTLVLFEKVAVTLGASKTAICHAHLIPDGLNGARVTLPAFPEFEGVVMPMKL